MVYTKNTTYMYRAIFGTILSVNKTYMSQARSGTRVKDTLNNYLQVARGGHILVMATTMNLYFTRIHHFQINYK